MKIFHLRMNERR